MPPPFLPKPSTVFSDIHRLRLEIVAKKLDTHTLLQVKAWRALADIASDWVIIFGCTWLVYAVSYWFALLVIPILGGRQRAIGNLLHEAVHRNLSRSVPLNQLIANCLIAPPIFANFSAYTVVHTQHHMKLGDAELDPENFLPTLGTTWQSWTGAFLKSFLSPGPWIFSILGTLVYGLSMQALAYILGWWGTVILVLGYTVGWEFVAVFLCLWFGARATTFHAYTAFRTLCDHWGRSAGGVFSKSREIMVKRTNLLRGLFHPYNNCYHLTHHLMPGIPYYNLPEAQALFAQTDTYQKNALVCDAYFFGPRAVVRWGVVDVRHSAPELSTPQAALQTPAIQEPSLL